MVDKAICRAVMAGYGFITCHFWFNSLGQLFAKLHPPLVIGVDVPDDALGEDLHLIHGDQSPQSKRCHHVYHDAVSWSVASELLVRSNTRNFSFRFASFL